MHENQKSGHVTHRVAISQENTAAPGQALVSTDLVMGKSTQDTKDKPEDICSQHALFHP